MADGTDRRPLDVPRWAVILVLLGAYLSIRGYHSRDGDQAYRLPLLLHTQDPALFADDPFVRAFDTFNPHRGALMLLDAASRPLGLSAGLAGLFALTFAVTCLSLDRLARAIWPEDGKGVGLVAVGLVLMAKAGNIGTNHLFEAMLLDRLIGFALGWLALAVAVSRPDRGLVLAPLAIGLATLVHPSVGLQLGLLLGASWISWSLWPGASAVGWRRLGMGLVLLGLAMAPGLWLTIGQGDRLLRGLPPEEFRLLSVEIQGPQHLLPHLWRFPQWLAWGCYPVLACLALGRMGQGGERRPWPAARVRLALMMAVNFVGLGIAWWGVEVAKDLRLTLFQPFRMATMARGMALAVLSGRVIALWRRGRPLDRSRATLLVVGLSGDWSIVVATVFDASLAALEVARARLVDAAAGLDASPCPGGWGQARRAPEQGPSLLGHAALRPSHPIPQDFRTRPPGVEWDSGTMGRTGDLDRMATRREGRERFALDVVVGIIVLGCGLVFLARHDTESGHLPILAALAVSAVGTGLARRRSIVWEWTPRRLAWAWASAWAIPIASLAASVLPGTSSRIGEALVARCRFADVPIDDVERLAVWCRDHTPPSARFVGPPGPKTFRLWSLRSLAFNRAASPYHAEGLADWSARFRDHVGFDGASSDFVRAYQADRHGLERRYDAMSDAERAALAVRNGATHILARRPSAPTNGPLELLHVEGRYAVYRLRPPEQVARADAQVATPPRR